MKKELKSEDQIIDIIKGWKGEIDSDIGSALRSKTYECFGGLIYNVGSELSNIVNSKLIKTNEAKLSAIKTTLAKYFIYENKK